MFTGCGTALVTPFRRDHSLDEETLRTSGAPSDRGRASISWCPAAPPAKAPRLRARSTCAWSRSRSKKPRARFPCWPAPAATTPTKSSNSRTSSSSLGRRRHPLRHSLLQQAHAGRPVSALPGHRRRHPPAHHRVQRAGPHRRERRARHARAPRRDRQHRRREGSLRQHRPDGQRPPRSAGRFHRALGRRCHHHPADGARRARRHLRGRRTRSPAR